MACQATSRIEVNLSRLLTRCEAMATDADNSDWRLEKYITALYDYMAQLRKLTGSRPSQEVLSEYLRRIELLRGIADAKKMTSASERSQAVEMLIPTSPAMLSSSAGSRDLHALTKARYQKEMRDELLGTKGDAGVRQRKSVATSVGGDQDETGDVDALLRHHSEMQERIAEEMLHLAKNLKENAQASNRIVREDTKKLSESSHLVDTNFGKLKLESERLEKHANRSCSIWIIVVIVVVVCTFIWMVIFMKMFPKK